MSVYADFFVAVDGDDNDSGTEDEPFATIIRARNAVRELRQREPHRDVLVLMRGGIHYIHKTVLFSLADSAPVGYKTTYAAYPDETPILSAGVPMKNWRRYSGKEGNIWVAALPDGISSVNTLYDRHGMLTRARGKAFFPAKGPENSPATRFHLHYPPGAISHGLSNEDLELAVIPVYPWAMNILPIKQIDHRRRVMEVEVPATYPLDKPGFGQFPDGSMWIENALELLDQPGEWCVNTKERKLHLWSKDAKPGDDILAPAVTELIRIEGQIDYDEDRDSPVYGLRFQGLAFMHGDRWNWESGKTGWGIQHDWEMFDRPSAMVRLRGAENCSFDGCRFLHSGATAIRMDLHCQNNSISNCHIEHIGGAGILLAGYGPGTKDVNRRNVIENNHIHHIGELLLSSPAILVWQSGENRITHNLIHHTPYTAVVISGRIIWIRNGQGECSKTIRWQEVDGIFPDRPGQLSWQQREQFLHGRNNILALNEIHTVMQLLGDGNCIYISGTGTGNMVVRNYLHDVDSYNINANIRCDDDQHGTTVDSNIVFRSNGEGFISKGNNTFTNNIFVDIRSNTRVGTINTHQRGYIVFPYGDIQGSVIQRNIFISREPGQKIITHGINKSRGDGGYLWECKADNNLYWNTEDPNWADDFLKEMQNKGVELNSISSDPGFMDLDGGDFRLKSDSWARKLGIVEIHINDAGLIAY